jgi:hypothetical protein
MTSPAKLAANRSNGRKSRGPRSATGKASASRNALRHGLAAITQRNPALFPEIERMAKALCGDDKNPFLFEQALTIAENQLVLRCVRAERIAMIERLRDETATPLRRDKSLAQASMRFRQAKLAYERLVQAKAAENSAGNSTSKAGGTEDSTHKQQDTETKPACEPKLITLRDEFDAMLCAMPDLDRLERYERRAWSRRKRAIRSFIEIKARS